MNGVIDYFELLDLHHFGDENNTSSKTDRMGDLLHRAELKNGVPLLDFLSHCKSVKLIWKPHWEGIAPTVSFAVKDIDPAEISALLSKQRIGIVNGNCYVYRLIEALGSLAKDGVVRISYVHYTSHEEIKRIINVLEIIIETVVLSPFGVTTNCHCSERAVSEKT